MKSIINLLPLFCCTVLFFGSCKSKPPREVVIDDKFKMEIPGFMSPVRNLNADASLQYQNLIRDMYVMVIEDEPEKVYSAIIENEWGEEYTLDFEGFCKIVASKDSNSFVIYDDRDKFKNERINGLNAYTFENSRTINDIDVYYQVALVQGKETFYQVICWTAAKKQKRHQQAITDMIYSFAEL